MTLDAADIRRDSAREAPIGLFGMKQSARRRGCFISRRRRRRRDATIFDRRRAISHRFNFKKRQRSRVLVLRSARGPSDADAKIFVQWRTWGSSPLRRFEKILQQL